VFQELQISWLQKQLKTKLLGPLKYNIHDNRLVIIRNNLYSIELFPIDDEQFIIWMVKKNQNSVGIVLEQKTGPDLQEFAGPFDALATIIAKMDQTIIKIKSSKARPLEAINIEPNSSRCMDMDQWSKFRELREQAKQRHTLELADQRAEAERLAEQERQARISAQLHAEDEQKQRLLEEIAANRDQAYNSLKCIIVEAHKIYSLMHSNSDDAAIGARIESSLDVLCADIDTLFDKLAEQDKTHKTNLTAELSAEFDKHQVFRLLDISLKPEEKNTNFLASLS